MAYDKVIDSAQLDADLTAVADAIRSKTGKTDKLTLEQMPGEIEGIEAGGGGGGFVDGNLRFYDYTVTIGENNGVTNHENFFTYLSKFNGGKPLFAYSLIGIANTYNQAIFGVCDSIAYRYRDGYIEIGAMWGSRGAYDAVAVPGTQYKVYYAERIE